MSGRLENETIYILYGDADVCITCIGRGRVSEYLRARVSTDFRAAEARYRNPDGVKMKVQISNLVQIFYNDHGTFLIYIYISAA